MSTQLQRGNSFRYFSEYQLHSDRFTDSDQQPTRAKRSPFPILQQALKRFLIELVWAWLMLNEEVVLRIGRSDSRRTDSATPTWAIMFGRVGGAGSISVSVALAQRTSKR